MRFALYCLVVESVPGTFAESKSNVLTVVVIADICAVQVRSLFSNFVHAMGKEGNMFRTALKKQLIEISRNTVEDPRALVLGLLQDQLL